LPIPPARKYNQPDPIEPCPQRTKADLVITSDDFRDYDASRNKALAGLVQANLMTSHIVFVGFSLSDPNYLRILADFRSALDPNAKKPTATAAVATPGGEGQRPLPWDTAPLAVVSAAAIALCLIFLARK